MGAPWARGPTEGLLHLHPPASPGTREGGGPLWILAGDAAWHFLTVSFFSLFFSPLVPAPGAGFLRRVVIRPYPMPCLTDGPRRYPLLSLSEFISSPLCKSSTAGGFASTFLRQPSSSSAQLLSALPSPHIRQSPLRSVTAKPLANAETFACSLFCPIMISVEMVCDVTLSLEKGSGAIGINLTCIFMGKICLRTLPAVSQLCLPLPSHRPEIQRCLRMKVQLFNKQSPDPSHRANPLPKHITLSLGLKQGLLYGPPCEGTARLAGQEPLGCTGEALPLPVSLWGF